MWNRIKGNMKGKKFSETKTRKDFLALTFSILIILVVVNFLAGRHFLRGDLTERKEYTLSDSTKKLLKNLDDVVSIDVYFSKNLPVMLLPLKQDLSDMLSEYKVYAGNNLSIRYEDPLESPQKEQQVQLLGIPPVQVNVVERDKHEVAKLYLGLAVMHEDRKEIMPIIQNTGNLEYDLTSAIVKVSNKEMPSVVWLSSGQEDEYKIGKQLLKKRYNLKEAKLEDLELDPVKDSLLILAVDETIPEDKLFIIDQYLMKGGRIFALVDRVSVGKDLQVKPVESNLFDWLKVNGVDVEEKLVVDRINSHAAFSGGYVTYHIPYPFWVKIIREEFDQKSPVVAGLDMMVLPWTSPVRRTEIPPEGVAYSVLAKSSPANAVVETSSSLMPEEAERYFNLANSEPRSLILMAVGPLKSAYGEGLRTPPMKDANIVNTAVNGQLIVVGNSRFVRDNFLKQFEGNPVFFENAVDYLAMGEELIGVRSRGVVDRPIKEISQTTASIIKYINIIFVPVLLVAFGMFVLFLRRQRRKALKVI